MSLSVLVVLATPLADPDPKLAVDKAFSEAGVRPRDRRSSGSVEDQELDALISDFDLIVDDPDLLESSLRRSLIEQGVTISALSVTGRPLEAPKLEVPGTTYDLATGTLTIDAEGDELEIALAWQPDEIVGVLTHGTGLHLREVALWDLRRILVRSR